MPARHEPDAEALAGASASTFEWGGRYLKLKISTRPMPVPPFFPATIAVYEPAGGVTKTADSESLVGGIPRYKTSSS